MKVHCLIDYDNLPQSDRGIGLASLARRIAAAVSTDSALDVLALRLYGGWYDEGGLTNDGTRLSQEIGSIFPFAVTDKGVLRFHLTCEIASAPVDRPADILPFTLRTKRGLRIRPRTVIAPHCIAPTACGVKHIQTWVSGICPSSGCTVSTAEAFYYREQKLVDTLLCCDLVAVCLRRPLEPVVLVSNDDDMIPAVLTGTYVGGTVHMVRTSARSSTAYDSLCQQNGVRTIQMQ
jgi:uncharacterized LabA/DUF88 family protein